MKYLHSMLIKLFLPTFLGAIAFFVLLLQVVDIFTNITQYINQEVPLSIIGQIILYYMPKAINTSIPMSLLFSVSFTLGNLYSKNELIAIFASGIRLITFVFPLIVIGLLLSIFSFFFEEYVVINTYSTKNNLQDIALSRVQSFDNHNVAVTNKERSIIYYVQYYNDKRQALSDIIIIERDNKNDLVQRVDSSRAYWNNSQWEFEESRIYKKTEDNDYYSVTYIENYVNNSYNMPPDNFKDPVKDISEMSIEESKKWIDLLQQSGKSQRALEDYMEYLKRYSMSFTPLIVAILSCALGGKFKKNVLLMSLLSSLSISVCYYVFQLISVEISLRTEVIPPLMGAWAPFILFTIIGLVQFKNART